MPLRCFVKLTAWMEMVGPFSLQCKMGGRAAGMAAKVEMTMPLKADVEAGGAAGCMGSWRASTASHQCDVHRCFCQLASSSGYVHHLNASGVSQLRCEQPPPSCRSPAASCLVLSSSGRLAVRCMLSRWTLPGHAFVHEMPPDSMAWRTPAATKSGGAHSAPAPTPLRVWQGHGLPSLRPLGCLQ